MFRQESGLRCLQALDFLLGGTCSPVQAVQNKEVSCACEGLQASSEQPQTHPDPQADVSLVSPEALISDPRMWLWGESQRVVVSFCKIHAMQLVSSNILNQ